MREKIRNDLVLILAIVLIGSLVFLAVFLLLDKGEYAVVEQNGQVIGRYPLSTDTEVEIISEKGINVLTVKDGEAFVSRADCPDEICVSHFPVSREGETVVCLPHGLVIRIECGEGGN